ncbi:hypothetical protein mRhiFer1_008500 [Rhinolophus ferrumequinum]|uniref:Uncharacterized protein n=1 Tax=Rhinolophus ferrumequinum TaxID=59479 RepID=A0A7J7UWZ0_RHIFE|nr:hypothetical protein mRhiFer1_008500 [Rhinolophus ferrumequinum]
MVNTGKSNTAVFSSDVFLCVSFFFWFVCLFFCGVWSLGLSARPRFPGACLGLGSDCPLLLGSQVEGFGFPEASAGNSTTPFGLTPQLAPPVSAQHLPSVFLLAERQCEAEALDSRFYLITEPQFLHTQNKDSRSSGCHETHEVCLRTQVLQP